MARMTQPAKAHGMQSRELVREAYSKSGKVYDDIRVGTPQGKLLGDHDVELYRRLCPRYQRGMRALEVGAGTGRFTVPTLQMGFELVATDINEAMLGELRARVVELGLSERCDSRLDDIFGLSFADNHFDYAFSVHVVPRLLNLDDQRAALCELTRVVKPGGFLLFNYRNRNSFYSRLHRGHTTRPSDIDAVLSQQGMRVVEKRSKHLINRTLLNRIPQWCGRVVSDVDRAVETWRPEIAWDVFVLAQKTQ